MEFFSFIMDFVDKYRVIFDTIKYASAVTILLSLVRFCYYQYHYVNVKISCGSFKVRRKDFTWQKLTPIVSRVFYDGENVPDDVRKELLGVTRVPVKNVVKFKNKK